jgi:hypothetical protein
LPSYTRRPTRAALHIDRRNIVARLGGIANESTFHAARVDPLIDITIVVLHDGDNSPAKLADLSGLVVVDLSLLSALVGRELRPRDLPDRGVWKRGQHPITFLAFNRRTVQRFGYGPLMLQAAATARNTYRNRDEARTCK